MKYNGYEIDSAYVSGGSIKWEATGSGEFVLGTKGKQKYFIKRNMHIRFPSPSEPKAVYEKYKKESDAIVRKQQTLRSRMSGLSWEKDYIVVEEENFKDEDNMFTTVTAYVAGALAAPYNTMDVKTFIELSKELALILKKLHSRGVIHGDLKEKNIVVVNQKGKYIPYLIDFDSSYTTSEIPEWDGIGGTEGYQSPEMVIYSSDEDAAESSSITTATDIFTMAVVMHRWWTGAFPGVSVDRCSVGAAIYLGNAVTIDAKFDVKIGDKCGATLMSLMNWMLAKDSKARPTADQVLEVLSDGLEVPETYRSGSDERPFDKELWNAHKLVAELESVDALKKKGIKAFKRANVGCGSKGLKYQVTESGGSTQTLSIEELISAGYAKSVAATVDTPWDEHDIEFISAEEISAKGYCKIEKTQTAYRKRYVITANTGTAFDKGYEWLIEEGLATMKVYDCTDITDTPWPEHGREYVKENVVRLGLKSISRVEVGGEHRYKIVYNEMADGKNKVNDKVSGNNLKLMGLIK